MMDVTGTEQQQLAGRFKELMATYRQSEDLINIGAYKAGSNPKIDRAIGKMDEMVAYMKQDIRDAVSFDQALGGLEKIFPADN